MMRRSLLLLVIPLMLGMLLMPMSARAFSLFGGACSAGGGGSAVCQDNGKGNTDPITGANGILHKITVFITAVAGLAAVIFIMLAGFKYITSGGEPAKVESAKSTLIYAVVGLVVIALAYSIVSLVLSKLS